MSLHHDTGRLGEQHAAAFLEEKGYRIAARNFHTGRGEIDLIAWSPENILVFVEVKTRSFDSFGGPENAVAVKKADVLARAAGVYMESIGYEWEIRFDTIAVLLREGQLREIRHVEDAFWPR